MSNGSRAELLSVIVPAYNAAEFLGEAIGCIQQQGYPELEILVVDDGSSDATGRVAAEFGSSVRYVRQENQGPAGARNHGLRLARGGLVTFLDADDLWSPRALEHLGDHLRDNPQTEVVLGRVQYVRRRADGASNNCWEPFGEPCVSLSVDAGIFRRSVFDKVGWFAPGLGSSDDIDWFMRAREARVVMKVLQEVVLFYRRHERNLTRDRNASHRDLALALKRSLDRRRANSLESLPPITEGPVGGKQTG